MQCQLSQLSSSGSSDFQAALLSGNLSEEKAPRVSSGGKNRQATELNQTPLPAAPFSNASLV
jgi:hypothetical protein